MGPSVYVILLLIYSLPFPPVACAQDPDDVLPVCEAHRQDSVTEPAEAEIALLVLAVRHVLGDDAIGIGEGVLGELEGDAVLPLVLRVLFRIPLEHCTGHVDSLPEPRGG